MSDKTLKFNGAVYTISGDATIRQREGARQIQRKLQDQDLSPVTLAEFALTVVYTSKVEGKGWHPPSPQASKEELVAALDNWFDEPAEFIEQWMAVFNTPADAVTGPSPLPEDADENLS